MRMMILILLLSLATSKAQDVSYEIADDSLPDVPKGTALVKGAKGQWYTAGQLKISAHAVETETPSWVKRVVTFTAGATYYYVDAIGAVQSRVKESGGASGIALDTSLAAAENVYETQALAEKARDAIKVVNTCKGDQSCIDKNSGAAPKEVQ